MNYQIQSKNHVRYVEADPIDGLISSEADALDWVAVCGESGTQRLMLHAGNFPREFYDLKSGLAGAVLLKFSNYRLIVAAVLPHSLTNQGKFREMALETNRGQQFRIFFDRESAEDWLIKA